MNEPLSPEVPVETVVGPNQYQKIGKVQHVDTSKGFWKWVSKFFDKIGLTKKWNADALVWQTFAAKHGFVYEQYAQRIPVAEDGIASVVVGLSDQMRMFFHHVSGQLQAQNFDAFVYQAEGIASREPNGVPSVTYTADSSRQSVATVLVGRITIKESRASTIILSKASGLGFDPARLAGDTSVQLEGNFNNYFSTYGPIADPSSVFRALPPNLMAKLMDTYQNYSIEIVGHSLYLFKVVNTKWGISLTSSGDTSPIVTEEKLEDLTARLSELASFFDLGVASNQVPQTNDTIIVENELPLNKLYNKLTKK